MSDRSGPQDPLLNGRLRAMQYLSDGAILFASVVLALVAGKGWAWGPAVLGPVVVASAAACNDIAFRVAVSALRPTEEQLRRSRARRRRRNVIIVPAYITFAIASGVIAGSLKTYWPDLGLGGIVLVTAVVIPLAILPRLKRRAEAMRASGSPGV
jgi:hypothetical protein